MSTTKGFLQQLVRTGQFRCVPVSEWDALTENQRTAHSTSSKYTAAYLFAGFSEM